MALLSLEARIVGADALGGKSAHYKIGMRLFDFRGSHISGNDDRALVSHFVR